jgi:hypothetical protein
VPAGWGATNTAMRSASRVSASAATTRLRGTRIAGSLTFREPNVGGGIDRVVAEDPRVVCAAVALGMNSGYPGAGNCQLAAVSPLSERTGSGCVQEV